MKPCGLEDQHQGVRWQVTAPKTHRSGRKTQGRMCRASATAVASQRTREQAWSGQGRASMEAKVAPYDDEASPDQQDNGW